MQSIGDIISNSIYDIYSSHDVRAHSAFPKGHSTKKDPQGLVFFFSFRFFYIFFRLFLSFLCCLFIMHLSHFFVWPCLFDKLSKAFEKTRSVVFQKWNFSNFVQHLEASCVLIVHVLRPKL